VHSLTAISTYTEYQVHAATPIPLSDAHKFHFLIDNNRDLFGIKTSETGTGYVEVHSYTAGSNYQTEHVVAGTPIPVKDAHKFQFLLAENRDLFCIKTSETGTGSVEVHSYTAGSNYRTEHVVAGTRIPAKDAHKFRFLLAPNRDLFCIKLTDTGSNSLEVHSLTSGSNYQNFGVQTGTSVPEILEQDRVGTFGLITNRKLMWVRKFLASGAPSASQQLAVTVIKYP
jgi:hypothetical protein